MLIIIAKIKETYICSKSAELIAFLPANSYSLC